MQGELKVIKQSQSRTVGRPFVKGEVANPAGRPRGLPDRRTRYRELIEARMPELVERCVMLALQGDVQALRLCLERVLPAIRPGDEPLMLPITAADTLSDRARIVVDAAFEGAITPAAAATMMTLIGGQSRVFEFDELLGRIQALEARANATCIGDPR